MSEDILAQFVYKHDKTTVLHAVLPHLAGDVNGLVHRVDLLSALGLFHRQLDQVMLGPGPHSSAPAVFFNQEGGRRRRLQWLPDASLREEEEEWEEVVGNNQTYRDHLRSRWQVRRSTGLANSHKKVHSPQ